MEDYLLEAQDELKRLEHIIYVSLKYTRTVDVLANALKRLVSTYDLIIEAYLLRAQEEGKIENLPKSPALRANRVIQIYPEDKQLTKYLGFYAYLKVVLKLPHRKREEYRRHVSLIVDHENTTTEIKIDHLMNCEKYIHRFYTYARDSLIGKPEEEEF
jgi:hypothetical protein